MVSEIAAGIVDAGDAGRGGRVELLRLLERGLDDAELRGDGGALQVHIADGDKGEERPVADENRGADHGKRARLEETKQQARAGVGERDALEHAEHADVGPLRLEAAGIEETDREEQRAAEEDAFHGGGAALALDDFRQSED